MKKKIFFILFLCMLALCALLLAGCDEADNSANGETVGSGETSQGDPGNETDDGSSDADKDGQGATVTESQWKAALSDDAFDNISYTMVHGSVQSKSKIRVQRQTVEGVYSVCAVNVNLNEDGSDGQESIAYYEFSGDIVYSYNKAGDTWQKRIESSYESDIVPQLVISLGGSYDSFFFDENTAAYTAETLQSDLLGEVSNVTAKFTDGCLTFLGIEKVSEDSTYFAKIEFYAHGTTSFSLPATYVDAGQEGSTDSDN